MSSVASDLTTKLFAETYSVATARRRLAVIKQAAEAVLFQAGEIDPLAKYAEVVRQRSTVNEADLIVGWGTEWVKGMTADSWRAAERELDEWLMKVPALTCIYR